MAMMKLVAVVVILVNFIIGTAAVSRADTVIKDYHGQVYLDSKQKYNLEWTIDWNRKTMFFNITVATNGWIGFGFSKDGFMKDADMVISGVSPDKRPYITDFHSDCHRNLKADNKQDWNLLSSTEVPGETNVQLSRLIDTCDSEDYPITEDLVYLIWAFGETDRPDYHHQNRGAYTIYLLDPVVHPALSSNSLPKWSVAKRFTVPPRVTTYWCSIHKAPPSNRKQHLIEFQPILDDPHDLAVNHVHHFVLWRCFAPRGVNPATIFEPLLSYEGEECYVTDHNTIPINYCRTMVYVWALGGRPLIFPDHVGIPFAESPFEYYMLETHYNNPEAVGGITFTSGVEMVYTPRLRPQDGGTLMINYDLFGLFMIPPGTLEFPVSSHCSPECTSVMFPPRGIDVFAIHTHTHTSGRKAKLHHFRNGKRLPWIIKDDNYNYLFQTPRPLQTDRKLLPGDHLTLECVYDDTWTNVTTFAGFAGTNEMCLQILYHTVPIPYAWCTSTIPQEALLSFVGVRNVTWDLHTEQRVVTSPPKLNGDTLAQVTDDLTTWTNDLRQEVAETTTTISQVITCPVTTPILASPDNDPTLGYGKQMMMGTYITPNVPIGSGIISKHPVTRTNFERVRTCPTF